MPTHAYAMTTPYASAPCPWHLPAIGVRLWGSYSRWAGVPLVLGEVIAHTEADDAEPAPDTRSVFWMVDTAGEWHRTTNAD